MFDRATHITRLTLSLVFVIGLQLDIHDKATAQTADENVRNRLIAVERAMSEGREREQRLKQTENELDGEIKALKQTLVRSARRTQSQEEFVTRLENQLNGYRADERIKLKELNRRRRAIDYTIAALQQVSRTPPAILIVTPGQVTNSVRAKLLLSSIVPQLDEQMSHLTAELAALRKIRTEIYDRQENLSGARLVMERERLALDRLIIRKSNLRGRARKEASENREQLGKLAESAKNLRMLIEQLGKRQQSRLNPGNPTQIIGRGFSLARGHLPMPVRGKIVVHYGQTNQIGIASKGLIIRTRDIARVITPHDGQIVFAGPFRGYGKLLIIAHGEGYHSLLAGFAVIDGIVGQWLVAGEPVGRMGRTENEQRPELYLEFRRNGEPIDPNPWIALTRTKVNR